MVAETLAGGDRPRCGNDLFGAFGRDFPTADGERLMIVAITPRQWSGLVQVLGIGEAVANLEVRLGVSFTADESARFTFRDVLVPIVAEAVAARHTADLASVFAANGVCWSIFRSVAGALADEPRLFNENPIFAMVDHPSGAYLTPGSAARLPNDQRHAAAGAPVLGNDTDAVLSDLLNMPAAEIGRLRDDGFIA
jgi:2-methylfumaryl-CoA isomerase